MGRKWSRKRKVEQRAKKASVTEANGGDSRNAPKNQQPGNYSVAIQNNARMEAYFALQGLHNVRQNDAGEFVPCVTEEEKETERLEWLKSMRSILPASFRIGRDMDPVLREGVERELQEFVGSPIEIVVDENDGRGYNGPNTTSVGELKEGGPQLITKKVKPADEIAFVPHGYQLSLDRRTIRRNPALTEFHEWLKVQTSAGFVTRQETVSMIPAVVLNPSSTDSILDMCAAPGSKTCQLLECVSQVAPGDLEPRGYVVANDSDAKRAYMLVHQLRRMNSPAVFVTSCDAQFFPLLDKGNTSEVEGTFDKVLCDVPCSGDGTVRKNPGIWKQWNQLGALALHPLQLGIALNGLRLTKVGGYMCYSTCSMNPVENEAVVAELLRSLEGSVELVEKRADLPGLKARPGWTSWRVMKEERTRSRKDEKNHRKKKNRKMQERRKEWAEKRKQEEEGSQQDPSVGEEQAKDESSGTTPASGTTDKAATTAGETPNAEEEDEDEEDSRNIWKRDLGPPPSWDEETLRERTKGVGLVEFATFEDVPQEWRRKMRSSCFPPTPEEVTKFGLDKCMRCLPQDMNTGGFFVALFKKVAPMSAKAQERAKLLALENRPDAASDNDDDNDETTPPATKMARIEPTDDISEIKSGADTGMETADSKMSASGEAPTEADVVNDEKVKKAPTGKPLLRGRGKTRGDLGNEKFLNVDDALWGPLIEFYGLKPSFPRNQLMARATGDAKILYFISHSITSNLIDRGIQDRLTVINSGLKAFERNSKDCLVNYRVAQEGIHFVAPHMTKQKIVADPKDFVKCLAPGGIRLEATFTKEFTDKVRALAVGSFVVALKGYEMDIFKKMFLVMWRCRGDAINCLVAKIEMDTMRTKLRALGEESITPDPPPRPEITKDPTEKEVLQDVSK